MSETVAAPPPSVEVVIPSDPVQEVIDGLIIDIQNAESAGSVTSEMVGNVFNFLNERAKTTAAKAREIDDEKTARAAGDVAIQNSVDALRTQLTALVATAQGDASAAVAAATAATAAAQINAEKLAQLTGKNLTDAIESINEILAFLDGIKDTETLAAKMEAVDAAITSINAVAADVSSRMETTEAQCADIVSKFGTLKEGTERALAEMSLKLDGKASASAVADLSAAVAGKADAASVDGALRRVQTLEAGAASLPELTQRVGALEAVEPPAKFEELASEAEYEARKAAGTLESDKLYYIPDAT